MNCDEIIVTQVEKFERLARFCLFDYQKERKEFLNQLSAVTMSAQPADNDELRRLITLADVLGEELGQDNLWERLSAAPYYVRSLLGKYNILPKNKAIFPRNRIKVYKIDSGIEVKAIRYIKDRERLIKASTKINDNLLAVSSIPEVPQKFRLGEREVTGDFLIGLEGNYMVDCPYSLESVKFLVKYDF